MKTKTALLGTASFLIFFFINVGSVLASTPVLTGAEDQPIDQPVDMSEAENCISLHGLKKTKILSNRVILFYTRGNKVFQNTLPKRCPGLRENSIISYKVRTRRLCYYDDITVLDDTGISLSAGFTCSLGKFQPVPNVEQLLGKEN